MNKLYSILQLIRPIQWLKNGFVFTGLIFSEGYHNPVLVKKSILTFIAFSLVASAIYVLNDIIDVEQDRIHPTKKKRPLASGKVSAVEGWITSLIFGIAGLLLGAYISPGVLAILVTYILINIAYSYWLKHVVILDVFCIAAGFMLRILAGTEGIGIKSSNWLLFCGLMITLFLGFSKRRAEIVQLGNQKEEHRQVLLHYTKGFLDQIIVICAAAVILSYSLYTMSTETIHFHGTDKLIYTVPFVIYALFRYLYLQHSENGGGEPTKDLLNDRQIMVCVAGWILFTLYLFGQS